MLIGAPRSIFNPYEWLPGYGESTVSFRSEGLDVVLEVAYEREAPDDERDEAMTMLTREIRFSRAHSLIKQPFPGSTLFAFDAGSGRYTLGELTEFTQSDWAAGSLAAWRSISSHTPPSLRHFSIQFMAENVAFHVLAEDVVLLEERPVVHTG
ncbi:hypothetical protein [Stenotrophomonas rhizophila]